MKNYQLSKIVGLWVLLMIFILSSSASLSEAKLAPEQQKELDEIREMIKRNNFKWVAGETSISSLTKEEVKALCGGVLSKESAPSSLEAQGKTNNPGASYSPIDWRDIDGTNYVTPVKDQKTCGSCWAFAAVAAVESLLRINGEPPGIDLSEQYLVSYNDRNRGCCGGRLSFAYRFLIDEGTTTEICYPYIQEKITSPPPCDELTLYPEASCSDEEIVFNNISGWEWVSRRNHRLPSVTDLQTALSNAPLAAMMRVYNSFRFYSGGAPYDYDEEDEEDEFLGLHVVLIVGSNIYEDPEDPEYERNGDVYWICKNSWGTEWGDPSNIDDGGYFNIFAGECLIGMDAAILSP